MNTHAPPGVAGAATLIRLESVSKRYPLPGGLAFDAIRDIDLEIVQGEIFGLIGKSGAGKSTLLRLINLLERPDRGRVMVAGQALERLGKRELRLARQGMGMIFQQFNLLQNATVFDNVAFPLRLHGGRSAAGVEARVRECLQLVGLAEKAGSYPAQLSGGQKQRVAIARALAPRPAVLLCDEPTSALDADTTASVLDTLREINQRLGVTVVIVTHELQVVQSLCTRVAVIEDGRLAEQFAVLPSATPRRTSLGRELSRRLGSAPAAAGAGTPAARPQPQKEWAHA